MKCSFIGHASILVEANGIKILSDPWWEGPCFGTQWWVYPRPDLSAIEGHDIDYIYISHGHHDHLHLGTLRRLPSTAKILANKGSDIVPFLEDCGFTVLEVADDEVCHLGGGVSCRIVATYSDDTMLVVDDGQEVHVNLNDALHAAPRSVQDKIIGDLQRWYPKIDYLFSGYGIASHFPNCYVVPGTDRDAVAARRQAHFNRQWVYIVAQLMPRFAFPFAADVVVLEEDLIWSNVPVHNNERPTDLFRALHPTATTLVYDIAPGFIIHKGGVEQERLFKPVDLEELRREYATEYTVANRTSKIPADGVRSLEGLIAGNIDICREYLKEFSGNYRALVRLRDAGEGILITKEGGAISTGIIEIDQLDFKTLDIQFTTRFAYLRRALTNRYGGEVLYVGSGCIIEYFSNEMVARNLHRELLTILQYREIAPSSRFGDQSKMMYVLKQAVKRLLGRKEMDLYDLNSWIRT